MKLIAYVFASKPTDPSTSQTFVRFDEMGYVNIVEGFQNATVLSPDHVAEMTRLLVMSHVGGFHLTGIYME